MLSEKVRISYPEHLTVEKAMQIVNSAMEKYNEEIYINRVYSSVDIVYETRWDC